MLKKTSRYIDHLQDFVNSYNDSPHKALGGRTPRSVYNAVSSSPRQDSSKEKKTKSKASDLKVGSLVRVAIRKDLFQRAFHYKWSERVYKIESINLNHNVPLYFLRDLDVGGAVIPSAFYRQELCPVAEDIYWEIEKVIRTRKRKNRAKELLVKYKHYKGEYWIPSTDLL